MAIGTLVLSALLISGTSQVPIDWPKTKAELTNYRETSSYAEVVAYLGRLQSLGAPIRISSAGKSHEGREIPLVVIHQDPNITPTQARLNRLPVVYLQANIHAGEVEGKEATLMLMRELAQNPNDPILKNLVIVCTPIYNCDGNDKWGPNSVNRGHQDGPDPVGKRENGQGFDLNRDCMKAATPEMGAILDHVYRPWNPDVIMDLHTTNGTRHGYLMTYSPGLNPNCDPDVTKYTRDDLLASIRKEIEKKHPWKMFDYGNVENRGGKQVYASFGAEPRYVTNYASVRNRIGVLTEAASFQPFPMRVESTRVFVRALLERFVKDRSKIVDLIERTDRKWSQRSNGDRPELGVTYKLASRGDEDVILEVARPANEINQMKAPTQYQTVKMPIWDRFENDQKVKLPKAYFILPDQIAVISLIQRHGIQTDMLVSAQSLKVRELLPSKITVANSAFQGVRMTSLQIDHRESNVSFPAGTIRVSTRQPLGLLAFSLLEPSAPDSVFAWKISPTEPVVNAPLPIYAEE